MRVFLLRHGTTSWNERGRLQGWSDAPLTRAGRREAARAGAAIAAAAAPARIVTSPLRRAIETAEIVSDRIGVERIETEPGWKERSFGSLEGTPADAAFDTYPELHPKSATFSATASLDGESCRAVVARVSERWREIRGADEPLVVVTHETPLRIVTGLVDREDPIEAIRQRSFAPGATVAVEWVAGEVGSEWTVLPRDRRDGGTDQRET